MNSRESQKPHFIFLCGISIQSADMIKQIPSHLTSLPLCLLLGCAEGLWHSLNAILVAVDVHNGHSWYFSNLSLQVTIAGGHNVAPVLLATLQ